MKWISVKDKLPKNKQNVVFWVKYEQSIWHAKTGWLRDQSDGHLFVIPSPYGQGERQVSHWMSLPDGPEVK